MNIFLIFFFFERGWGGEFQAHFVMKSFFIKKRVLKIFPAVF